MPAFEIFTSLPGVRLEEVGAETTPVDMACAEAAPPRRWRRAPCVVTGDGDGAAPHVAPCAPALPNDRARVPLNPLQVSVRCWPDGRVLIQGSPAVLGAAAHEEELHLPLLQGQRLVCRSAHALFTDTGRLYVRVEVTAPAAAPTASDYDSRLPAMTTAFV